jgi:plastocyanin
VCCRDLCCLQRESSSGGCRSIADVAVGIGLSMALSATVTLTADGRRPATVVINVGGRVSFVNSDTRPHEIVSDPYLRHEDCPPINRVGFLTPGQERASAVFEVVRDCGFHDHLDQTEVFGRIDVRIE